VSSEACPDTEALALGAVESTIEPSEAGWEMNGDTAILARVCRYYFAGLKVGLVYNKE